ncbi:MAG: Hpt domain-containing protein [Gemmatimonadetes bacterium]|nr:Hpt domain-containing protein [Gemmatimonadota bacterium]
MDLSRYAALFLTESREQRGACGQALLEWERQPAAVEPVVSLYRAMHTFKGMAAAMGYSNLTELAHRSESVLDLLRSDPGAGEPLIDLFFRVVDALEQGASQAVEGGDAALSFTALLAELDEASVDTAPTGSWAIPAPAPAPAIEPVEGREVRVEIRPDAMMRGARALIALRKAEGLGTVSGVVPPPAAFERDEFDGKFRFTLATRAPDEAISEAIRAAGDVQAVAGSTP